MPASLAVSHQACVRAQSGRSAELAERLQVMVATSRRVKGCLDCSLQRSPDDPDLWLIRGTWDSPQALSAYFDSPALQIFAEVMHNHLVSRLDLQTFDPVAP